MKVNMGLIDRVGRILLATVVVILYTTEQISGIGAIILLVLSAVFMLTGVIGFCPLYVPFKFSTKSKKTHELKNNK